MGTYILYLRDVGTRVGGKRKSQRSVIAQSVVHSVELVCRRHMP